MPVRRQFLWLVAAVPVFGLIAALMFADVGAFLGSAPAAPGPSRAATDKPEPVVVQPVGTGSDGAVIEAVGTGKAARSVTLFPEDAGRVEAVLYEAGDRVEQGQPLLRLDDDEERLAVELARVRLKDAEQKMARYEKAAPTGGISATVVDEARTALELARLELQRAELELAHRTLTAPFAGVTGIAAVEAGDRVTEDTAVGTLDDRSVLLVDFEIPEVFARGVKLGSPLTVESWARPGERFEGEVASVDSRIDPQKRTLRLRARVPNDADRLRAGMAFRIRLPLAGDEFATVPSVAIQWDRTGAYVWLVADTRARRVPVRVIKRSDGLVMVEGDIAPGDRVVVEGVQRLRGGMAVELLPAAPPIAEAEDTADE